MDKEERQQAELAEQLTEKLTAQFKSRMGNAMPVLLESIRKNDWGALEGDDLNTRKFKMAGAVSYMFGGRAAAKLNRLVCTVKTDILDGLDDDDDDIISIDLNQPELDFARGDDHLHAGLYVPMAARPARPAKPAPMPSDAESWRKAWRDASLDALLGFCRSYGFKLQLELDGVQEKLPFVEWSPETEKWRAIAKVTPTAENCLTFGQTATVVDGARQMRTYNPSIRSRIEDIGRTVATLDYMANTVVPSLREAIQELHGGAVPVFFEIDPSKIVCE